MELSWCSIIVTLVVSYLVYLCYKVKTAWSFFSENGIPHVRPFYNFRGTLRLLFLRDTLENVFDVLYHEPSVKNAKIIGTYQFLTPSYYIKDPKIIENILIKDFTHFHDHMGEVDTENNPLNNNLFNLRGLNWKIMRTKLSPIFTTGKIKWMLHQIIRCGDNLVEYFDKIATGEDVEFKPALNSFSMDVIASCAFGLDTDTIRNPNSKFTEMAYKLMRPSGFQIFWTVLGMWMPKLWKTLKFKGLPDDINDFFINITKETMKQRINSNEKRNDFIQLLIQLKQQGYVDVETEKDEDTYIDKDVSKDHKFEFTDEVLAAQLFIFFIAGFENAATLIGYTLLFLANKQEMQDKVRTEINTCIKKEGSLTYEALKNMTYLECCMSETLRLTASAILFRECTKDYTIENIPIKKGNSIVIPLHSIHRDKQYYENPLEYIPDRFLDSKLPRQSSGIYLPFGDGPRVCIARRFVLLQAKIALVKIISNFHLLESSKNLDLIHRDPSKLTNEPKGGMTIKIKKL